MDDATFLAAVLAAPASDAPRLVYADWLDEAGSPRGEFIRVQCELAGLEAVAAEKQYRPRRARRRGLDWGRLDALRCRERELLAEYEYRWVPPLLVPQAAANGRDRRGARFNWSWSRGFIEAISLSAADWLGGPCGRCGGEGRYTRYPNGQERLATCPACAGTGRTDPLGPRLVRSCPLTEVRFSDRRPAGNGPCQWADGAIHDGPERIPDALWRFMERSAGYTGRLMRKGYDTAEAAHADLSWWALAWALARPAPEVEARRD